MKEINGRPTTRRERILIALVDAAVLGNLAYWVTLILIKECA